MPKYHIDHCVLCFRADTLVLSNSRQCDECLMAERSKAAEVAVKKIMRKYNLPHTD